MNRRVLFEYEAEKDRLKEFIENNLDPVLLPHHHRDIVNLLDRLFTETCNTDNEDDIRSVWEVFSDTPDIKHYYWHFSPCVGDKPKYEFQHDTFIDSFHEICTRFWEWFNKYHSELVEGKPQKSSGKAQADFNKDVFRRLFGNEYNRIIDIAINGSASRAGLEIGKWLKENNKININSSDIAKFIINVRGEYKPKSPLPKTKTIQDEVTKGMT